MEELKKQANIPDQFLSEGQLSAMLSFLQSVPGTVDVRNQFALFGEVWLLVVGSHFALQSEKQNLEIPFLDKPGKREMQI